MQAEFPCLATLLQKEYQDIYLGVVNQEPGYSIDVKVRRIDANLMYFTGDYCNGVGSRLVRENEIGTLRYDIHLVNSVGTILYSHPRRKRTDCILKDWLLRVEGVSSIVKVEERRWYEPRILDDENIADFEKRKSISLDICIYKSPKEGISSFLFSTDLWAHIVLDNHILIKMYQSDPSGQAKVEECLDRLKHQFKSFFQMYLQAEMYKERTFNFELNEIKFRSFACAGRLLITLEKGEADISYAALDEAEEDCRMGVNSLHATITDAQNITQEFILGCLERFGKGEQFSDIFKTGTVCFAGQIVGNE